MRTLLAPTPIPNSAWTATVRQDWQALVGLGIREVDYGIMLEFRPVPGICVQLTHPRGRMPMPMPATPQPYELPKMREPSPETTEAQLHEESQAQAGTV